MRKTLTPLPQTLAVALLLMAVSLGIPPAAAVNHTDIGDFIHGNAPGVLLVKLPDGTTRRSDATTNVGCVLPQVDDCVPAVWLTHNHVANGIWKVTIVYDYVPTTAYPEYYRIGWRIDGWQFDQTWTNCAGAPYSASWTIDFDAKTWSGSCGTLDAI